MDRAARVSLGALGRFLRARPDAFETVTVVLFQASDVPVWESAADAVGS